MIIPRGAENTQAIDLIAQHLKFGLNLHRKENLCPKASLHHHNKTHHDLLQDTLGQFTHSDVKDPIHRHKVLGSDIKHHKVLAGIFEDFIKGRKLPYHKMFLEYVMNSLFDLYSKGYKHSDKEILIIENESNDMSKLEEGMTVTYFKPIFIDHQDTTLE